MIIYVKNQYKNVAEKEAPKKEHEEELEKAGE